MRFASIHEQCALLNEKNDLTSFFSFFFQSDAARLFPSRFMRTKECDIISILCFSQYPMASQQLDLLHRCNQADRR